jgi:hypothetical protein
MGHLFFRPFLCRARNRYAQALQAGMSKEMVNDCLKQETN